MARVGTRRHPSSLLFTGNQQGKRGLVVDAELVVGDAQVVMHGVCGYSQLLRRFFHRQPAAIGKRDVTFAPGQPIDG